MVYIYLVCRRLSVALIEMKSILLITLSCFTCTSRLIFCCLFWCRSRQSDAQIHSAQLRALSRSIPSPSGLIDSEVRSVVDSLCLRVEARSEQIEVSGLKRQVNALVQLRESYGFISYIIYQCIMNYQH